MKIAQCKSMWSVLFVLLVVGVLGSNVPAWSDEVVMASGKQLKGEIVSFEDNEITLKTSTDEFQVNVRMVESVESDAATGAKKDLLDAIRQKITERESKPKSKTGSKGGKKQTISVIRGGM